MSSGTTLEKKEIEQLFMGFAVEVQKQMTEEMEKPKKRVIIISGPTACGKSKFALNLAKEIGGEIISVDSMQVYRGMDIGTFKPTKEERGEVPHHLLDIRNVTDSINVVDFYFEARHACREIFIKEGVPIFVGGSGFYIHALLYGPPSGPPPVPELRKSLEEEMEKEGVETLYERLRQLDPHYASTITKHDKQKIIRALEIIEVTGKKVSKHAWSVRKRPRIYDFRCWFLHRPKEKLYERIEKRCDAMVEKGFLDEVKALEKAGIRENPSAAQAIGYRQALEYLQTKQTDKDYDHFVESFKKASRHYAKRQFTWFRKEPLFRWLDLDLHDPEVAMEMVKCDYESNL